MDGEEGTVAVHLIGQQVQDALLLVGCQGLVVEGLQLRLHRVVPGLDSQLVEGFHVLCGSFELLPGINLGTQTFDLRHHLLRLGGIVPEARLSGLVLLVSYGLFYCRDVKDAPKH